MRTRDAQPHRGAPPFSVEVWPPAALGLLSGAPAPAKPDRPGSPERQPAPDHLAPGWLGPEECQRLYGLARGVLKCRSLADLCRGWGLDSEDLAQEFVMRMARPGGPPESVDEPARPRFGTRASAYLQRSLHNLAIDVQRRISREQAVLRSAAAEARLRPPSEPLSRMLAGRAFESMLEPLPRDVAVVLRLHFEDNLSFRHIADRLDLTLDAARARYYRGVNRLRQSLSVALGLNGRNRSRRSR